MNRFIGAGALIALLLLTTQVVYAQYDPVGPVSLSSSTPQAGGTIVVSGSGFDPDSTVRITIESTPTHLATVTVDPSGAFSASVAIPSDFSGSHTIKSTGIAPDGSVRVLASTIVVQGVSAPPTDTVPRATAAVAADAWAILAIAAAGIALVTLTVVVTVRRTARP